MPISVVFGEQAAQHFEHLRAFASGPAEQLFTDGENLYTMTARFYVCQHCLEFRPCTTVRLIKIDAPAEVTATWVIEPDPGFLCHHKQVQLCADCKPCVLSDGSLEISD